MDPGAVRPLGLPLFDGLLGVDALLARGAAVLLGLLRRGVSFARDGSLAAAGGLVISS